LSVSPLVIDREVEVGLFVGEVEPNILAMTTLNEKSINESFSLSIE
jgi:hypothetical protein